jgi:hypothetical protein
MTTQGRPAQVGPPARRAGRRTGLSVLLAVVVVLLAVLALVVVNHLVGQLSAATPAAITHPEALVGGAGT